MKITPVVALNAIVGTFLYPGLVVLGWGGFAPSSLTQP